ncbi:hypothetical protein G6F56_011518 [Rhizopus delemar]|nr:hypothetical protein G6F56_011518 [Rhizopus delemar]
MTRDFLKRNEPWRVWETDKIEIRTLEAYPVNKIDWYRVSDLYVRTRDTTECLIQWTTQEHPLINKTPWTKTESNKLKSMITKYGADAQWEKIANELGTNRTISQCFSRHMASKHTEDIACPKWSPEEDLQLVNYIRILGTSNWQMIAAAMGSRTGQQCLQRWTKSIDPSIKRCRWTSEEDEALRKAADFYGVGNWRKIQRLVHQRTDMQCRERWVNMLDDTINHEPATQEEEEQINELVEQYGTKWSLIASFIPGRTDNSIMKIYNKMKKSMDSAKRNELIKTKKEMDSKKISGRRSKRNTRGASMVEFDDIIVDTKEKCSEEINAERDKRREQRAKRRAELMPPKRSSKKRKMALSGK